MALLLQFPIPDGSDVSAGPFAPGSRPLRPGAPTVEASMPAKFRIPSLLAAVALLLTAGLLGPDAWKRENAMLRDA